MNWRYLLVFFLIGCLAVWFLTQYRLAHCAPVPLLTDELLPNADLSIPGANPDMPAGWVAGAPGVKLGSFALDGDQRSLHLMGIANVIRTPLVAVEAGRSYCFVGHAITDSVKGSSTRVRLGFRWLDDQGRVVAEPFTDWQPVVLWQPDNPPDHWSRVDGAFTAPPGASTLQVGVHPSSDDRIYLDVMHVQQTTRRAAERVSGEPELPLAVAPFPSGNRAALSFSFDWETAMAGLVHSRSVGDPYADQDPIKRGLRMRQGITTTLDLFRPYGIQATYYAAGYTFLLSNTTRTEFMDNPTYGWATTENRWMSDHWTMTPWFAPDPYGTVRSHPAWYAGDLVPRLLHEGHDIQSHTFTHFYGGFVATSEWREDMPTWERVAARRGVAAPRSLAFPWSSSGGMSDADWEVLEQAGLTSVTRLSDQSQYNLFPTDKRGLVISPHCRPLPGHESLLACPDFYLTPETADLAVAQIDRTLQEGGVIDLWSHTEEVVSEEQQAAWGRVVRYAAEQPGLWVAPLREIADWQHATAHVSIEPIAPHIFAVSNRSGRELEGLTLRSQFDIALRQEQGTEGGGISPGELVLDLGVGQTVEVQLWP